MLGLIPTVYRMAMQRRKMKIHDSSYMSQFHNTKFTQPMMNINVLDFFPILCGNKSYVL